MKRAETQKRKNKFLTVLNCFLAVILALMLGVTALAHQLMNQMNRVERPAPESAGLSGTQILENGSQNREEEALLGAGKEIVNILLIGQDRREGESRARSDAMILLTVNKDTKSVVLTSFLRDLYVSVPGHGSNRLNASYAWGGMELLNQTLAENFGIYVDGNVEVDFNQFARIIDLAGGVEITIREDEAGFINKETGSSLTEGTWMLNGAQALAYSRIRKLDADGDFSRTQRQRTVINAMIRQFRDAGVIKLLGLVEDVLPMVTTDMSNNQILSYAASLLPLLGSATVVNQRIPADGAYSYAMVDGMSVLQADMEASRQLLRETLGGQR